MRGVAPMEHIDTLIVSDNRMVRESLVALLSGTRFTVRQVAASPALHLSGLESGLAAARLALVVIDEEAAGMIGQVAEALPEVRIVALALRDTEGLMLRSLQLGASAYLTEDVSPADLLKTLEVVIADCAVLPMSFLGRLCLAAEPVRAPGPVAALTGLQRADGTSLSSLSSREVNILEGLALGESNKVIARNLDIAEATVKVHVKAILRKVRVKNRTQAAVWAMNKGIVSNGSVPTERFGGLVPPLPLVGGRDSFSSGALSSGALAAVA